ncbi:MAG: response regulator, partial [Nitrosomonadales bacterium]|nr:response regulator [Nitrosomonadales bacterium]
MGTDIVTNHVADTAPHILLVEDERKLAQVLCEYLMQSGFEVTMLEDGLAVEPWMQSHQPQLVILDVMLPGKDGLTLLQQIRRTSLVPIMLTTARIEEIDRL